MTKNYSFAKALGLFALLGLGQMNAQTYCSQAAVTNYDDEIFNVTLGTLNNTSNCSQTGGPGSIQNRYSNYTSNVTAPNLMMGSIYPMSVVGGECNGYSYCGTTYVWIDYNQNGLFTDPGEDVWTSNYTCWAVSGTTMTVPGGVTIPYTAIPGITRMRVTLAEGSVSGPCGTYYYGETEDYNVNIVQPPPCSGVPAGNTVLTPTYEICPNSTAYLTLANTYTTYGFTYQWQSSTISAVGPFSPVSGGTLSTLTTPNLNVNTYFSAIITCTNSTSSTVAVAGQVSIQPVVIDNVPYYENFESIINDDDLPNCSWTASSLGQNNNTYNSARSNQRVARSGNKFGSFYYSPSGSSEFYSNGIQMYAGVTYSASLWYATNYYGDLNWDDLSIFIGSSQNVSSMFNVASTNGPAVSTSYKSLANTFTVPSDGIYYVGVQATSNGGCCAYYLNWDDLRIEAPCSINTPSLSLATSASTICAGDPVSITASGMDAYVWSHGPVTAGVTETPANSVLYTVVGTNTATGCNATMSSYITVLATPNIFVFADKPVVCSGKPVVISASGASTYTWNNSSNANFITANPTSATVYSVLGQSAAGCVSQGTVSIAVNPLPNVTGATSQAEICVGETATLTGGGAVTYQWASNTLFVQTPMAIVSPNVPTTYTLTGTDANGCMNSVTVAQGVQECVGINEVSTTLAGVKVYPNPTGGAFTIELNNGKNKAVSVLDITGRVVMTASSNDESIRMDISKLANGVYYVRISSDDSAGVIKLIKN